MSNPLQTRFGKSALLLGARGASQSERLIDVDLTKIDPHEIYRAGSWVLTLEAHNDLAAANASGGTATTLGTLPVIATVTIGTGGAAIPFNVSVLEGTTIALPVAVVSVDVSLAASGTPNMRVSGVIQRSTSNNFATLVQALSITSATLVPQTSPIPPMVTGVRLESSDDTLYSGELMYTFNNLNVNGQTFRDLALAGAWYPILPVARAWQITAKPLVTMVNYPLSGNVVWRIGP